MIPFALQAFALSRTGEHSRAVRLLVEVLQESRTVHVFFVVVNALPAAAQLAAGAGDLEQALALSALAGRYPYVANSRWFADVVGADVDEWAASLAPEIAAAARARGRALDLWQTAEELIDDFGGDSL